MSDLVRKIAEEVKQCLSDGLLIDKPQGIQLIHETIVEEGEHFSQALQHYASTDSAFPSYVDYELRCFSTNRAIVAIMSALPIPRPNWLLNLSACGRRSLDQSFRSALGLIQGDIPFHHSLRFEEYNIDEIEEFGLPALERHIRQPDSDIGFHAFKRAPADYEWILCVEHRLPGALHRSYLGVIRPLEVALYHIFSTKDWRSKNVRIMNYEINILMQQIRANMSKQVFFKQK
jgi:hypothetical protein